MGHFLRGGALSFLLSLALARPAVAAGEVSFQAGAAYATPTGMGASFAGPAFAVRGAGRIAGRHAVGGVARYYGMAVVSDFGPFGLQDEYQLALDYRFSVGPMDRVHPVVGGSAGIGIWSGCINGDLCGGFGPVFAGLAGVGVPLSKRLAFDAFFEGNFHSSIPNGVEIMVMPTLWLGLTFVP